MGRQRRYEKRLGEDELEQKWKRRRLESIDSSAVSEASVIDSKRDDFLEVYPGEEPPKLSVQTDRILTIPMDKGHQPLPPCEGPKLEPFSDGDVRINFLRRLGDNAAHSNVFEVVIDGKNYALKMFKTSSSDYFPDEDDWPDGAYPGHLEMVYQFRPFYRECRAYGRINECHLSHRYWRAYGYVRLPPYLRDELCDITGLPDHYWQVRPLHFDGEDKGSTTVPEQLYWPIYGIVKEMAPFPGKEIDPKQRNIRTMSADLRQLHKAGIINGDMAERNYMSGRMIDFSLSFTLPHLWFERPSGYRDPQENRFDRKADSELNILRFMIIESGVKTTAVQDRPDGCIASRTRSRRLRSRVGMLRPLSPLYELGVSEPQPWVPLRRKSSSGESWLSSIIATPVTAMASRESTLDNYS